MLATIERHRKDDVVVKLQARILLAPIVPSAIRARRDSAMLGSPWEAGIAGSSGTGVEVRIAKSEWVNYLRTWKWSEIELFELVMHPVHEVPEFRRAFDLLRSAEERLRNGDYQGVFQNCRQVLESLAIDAAPDERLGEAYKAILHRIAGEKKRERLHALLLALNKLGHLGRHENRPHEDLTRPDAVFMLRTTLSVVQYLAGG